MVSEQERERESAQGVCVYTHMYICLFTYLVGLVEWSWGVWIEKWR